MKPAQMYYLAGMNIFNDKSWHVGIGVHRDKQRGDFEQAALDSLADLLPHLQRAILIQREFTQLQLHKRALTEGLSRLALGMMLLDGRGSPIYINPVAESILANHPAITLEQGAISAYHTEQKNALRKAVSQLADNPDDSNKTTPFTITLSHPSKKLPLTVMLSVHRNPENILESLYDNARIIMYLSDAEATASLSTDGLNQVYGLSEAEALVAIGITNGLSVEQVAEANHVSVNTVKTQLKSVFRKTKCNRQVDLVRLLLSNPLMQSA